MSAIKATIAAASFAICCLGNPSGAEASCVKRCDNSGNNRGNTYTRNVDRSRTVNRSSFDYSEITNEATQHAAIPALPATAAPDSVAVLSLYTQYSEGAGHTHGAAISIPLFF